MESDRMHHLLPALSQDKLDNQRDVVKNERRQRYENPPYGMAWDTDSTRFSGGVNPDARRDAGRAAER